MHARRADAGFTIIELMVAILIIGILLSIAIPAFNSAIEAAKTRACMSNLRALDSAVEQWKARTELDPATRWGGVCVDQDPLTRGTLVADLYPSIANWDDAIHCTSVHVRHHVTIEMLASDRSTARFLCQGGTNGVPHKY